MFTWKIPEVYANEGLITHVKYFVSLSDEKNTVETEGYWHFDCPELDTPFLEVTEEMIAGWIEKEAIRNGSCHITDRLQEQLKDLESKAVPAPWMPQVFKPEI